MPIIHVQMLPGRTPMQKSAFIEAVAHAAMQTLSVPEDTVRIVLAEVSPEDWGVGTRTMAELRRGGDIGPASR